VGNWPLYRRLYGASFAVLCCAGLVLPVNTLFAFVSFVSNFFHSCQGGKDDLDGPLSRLPRTRDLTEKLITNYQVGALWDKFGIISDVVVSRMQFPVVIQLQT
jgi:hypothetical protein